MSRDYDELYDVIVKYQKFREKGGAGKCLRVPILDAQSTDDDVVNSEWLVEVSEGQDRNNKSVYKLRYIEEFIVTKE